MSRRDSDSDSRHHRSRLNREPSSPKRVRRDGKTATERPARNLRDPVDHIDRDQKHHWKLQDSMPLEAPVVPVPKVETVSLRKESDKKNNGTKISSENIEAPRSRSQFQHDERAGQVARSFRHRETTERDGWKDSKDRHSVRSTNRNSNNDDKKPRNEKTRFDGFDKADPPSKKRPSFQETKIQVETETGYKSETQFTKIPVNGEKSERKEERGKLVVDHRNRHGSEMQRIKFQSKDRFRGRDRFKGQNGGRVEKWKHDLYDEANKSPTSKNEEDQIAKVEALLAS